MPVEKKFYAFLLLLLLFPAFAQASMIDSISSDFESLLSDFGKEGQTIVITREKVIGSGALSNYPEKIEPEEVCMSLGVFKDSSEWQADSKGTRISYSGKDEIKVRFFIVCDKGNEILKTLKEHPSAGFDMSFVSHCSQFLTNSNSPRCAVILSEVKKAEPTQNFPPPYLALLVFVLIAVWPALLAFRSLNYYFKAIYLIKFIVFIFILLSFNFTNAEYTWLLSFVLLFFFFFELVLSIAPKLLGFLESESKNIRLAVFVVMVFEAISIFWLLFIIWFYGLI
jgi:hypothetical protein